jgi:DNA-binding NtrC family response regulator
MMAKLSIFVCVQKDILLPITWSLKAFEATVAIKQFDKIHPLSSALENEEGSIVLLDSMIAGESTLAFAQELKRSKPAIKIVLIVSLGTSKEEVIEIIKLKIVSGVLLRPFSAEQVSDYVYKLCGFQKPADNPWFVRKG